MVKYIIIYSIAFFLVNGSVNAQHCPYDGTFIMIVEITSENDSLVIPNLEVTFLDSLGNKVVDWTSDTLKLWQNPKETSHSGTIDNENPMNPWSIRFWFATDNYVFVTGRKLPGIQLKIEDIDGDENGGHFQTKIINLAQNNLYNLCTNFSDWDQGDEYGFVKDYKPIKVKLNKR